jgi:PAS domain S-box-containing protein
MKSSLIEPAQIEAATIRSGDDVIEQLTARISELEEANANLQYLDEAMRRNNALFEAILANSWQGITLTGQNRRILKVVRGLAGRPQGELQGALVESLALPDDREIIIEAYRKLLRRACAKITIEFRMPRADGTIAWFSATVTDMLDDPNVQCIVWNYTDITKEKQTAPSLVPY